MKPIILNESELEETFSHSSGPGGQNVNKVSTRVTLRHKPTNLFVTVQESRSQAQNRQLARERLAKVIDDQRRKIERAERDLREKERRRTRRPSRAAKARNLESKRRRAVVKRNREKAWES